MKKLLFYSTVFCMTCATVSPLSGQARYGQEMVGTLIQHVRSLQDENAKLGAAVNSLETRVRALQENESRLYAALEQLKKQVAADVETRKAQFSSIERLAKDLSKLPQRTSTASNARESGRTHTESEPLSRNQEYVEHIVEPGTTLSALSKAYKVPLQEIRRVNKLRSDTINVGQKLLIPVQRPHR